MFFLFRSAFCIGAVALAAAGNGDRVGLESLMDHAGPEVVQSLGRACLTSQDCLRIGMTLVAPADRPTTPAAEARRPSADTLQPADLLPGWTAPRVRPPSRRASGIDKAEPGATTRAI